VRIAWYSFHGRYSDNPRALHERLLDRSDLDHVWLADPDHAAAFPPGTTTVDVDSPAATEVLESADVVVANTHVEVPWTKPSGTTYVQTWHGTPLKRIHRDVLWAPPGRLDRLDHDVAKWDLLLSPNAASTPRLRGAFHYRGEVLESGYPRNDLLSSRQHDEVRAKVRADLGVAPDVTVVLYAPTWRDDEVFTDDAGEVPLALDPRAVVEALPGHALLVRAHNMVTGRSRLTRTPGAFDVSYHPDVRDLYAAADVLVTDYSSTMFDFAITGRPIVFYAYDLERFQDSVRGFYFDLLPEAPGPVVRAQDELVQALRALPDLAPEYAERYAAFRARYTSLEDGHAAERVLAHLGLSS
jgi:CDP-glycerol glycerophosphotransferase